MFRPRFLVGADFLEGVNDTRSNWRVTWPKWFRLGW
jgi:hypothetical protein